MTTQAPIYAPINDNQIRLLHLIRDNRDDRLSGRIKIYDLISDEAFPPEIVLSTPENVNQPAATTTTTSSLGPAPPYCALSYHWGDRPFSENIRIITDSDSGGPEPYLDIRPNLADVLKELRRSMRANEMILWIDAICIDQGNAVERKAQIQRMADIYSRAKLVYIWLGQEYEQSALAFRYAKNMPDIRQFNENIRNATEGIYPEIKAFCDIMHRDWFSRRWIVQEICLARKALVLCGKDSISWGQLEEAISLFSNHRKDIQRIARQDKRQGNPTDYTGEMDGMAAVHLVEITNNITHRAEDGSVTEHRSSLEGLMSSLTMFKTSNPYDVVYALIWLASDYHNEGALAEPNAVSSPRLDPTIPISHESPRPVVAQERLNVPNQSRSASTRSVGDEVNRGHPPVATGAVARDITINYELSVFEVYAAFLLHVFKRSKSIDMLCRPWAMQTTTEPPPGASAYWRYEEPLPSWMLILESNTFFEKNEERQVYERIRADPLVGKPGTGSRNYVAYGRLRADGISEPRINVQNRTLDVLGFKLGGLFDRQEPAQKGVIPEEWLREMGWRDNTFKRKRGEPAEADYGDWRADRVHGRPEWIWRLLVADRDIDGNGHPPTRWRSVSAWVFDHRTKDGGIDTLRKEQPDEDVEQFLRRARAVVWERRLAKIRSAVTRQPLYALVPKAAKDGDVVCILAGCSVPVVLRKSPHQQANENATVDNAAVLPTAGVDGYIRREPVMVYENEKFLFIGEAYVQGMMYAEGFKHRRENGERFRRFIIE